MGFSVTLLSDLASATLRSTLLGVVALLLVLAFRIRGAAARHAVVTAVLAGMLLLPALQPLLPPLVIPMLSAEIRALPDWPVGRPSSVAVSNQRNGKVPAIHRAWRPTWKSAPNALTKRRMSSMLSLLSTPCQRAAISFSSDLRCSGVALATRVAIRPWAHTSGCALTAGS